MIDTVVDVGLAAVTFVAGGAVAAETTLFEHFAGGGVAAGVAVTGVDGRLAELAVVARCALALVVPLTRRPAGGSVLARERVASVALGQDLVGNFGCKCHQMIPIHSLRMFLITFLAASSCASRLVHGWFVYSLQF